MIQAIYLNASVEPELIVPDSVRGKTWERSSAIREVVRGRMEVCGPITVGELSDVLLLPRSELDAGIIGARSGRICAAWKFRPHAPDQEWCDRRLLARIHRLTIDRLRAEIQPVSPQDFYRFLFAWQRADPEHRVEGPEGLQSVLEYSTAASYRWPRGSPRSSPRVLPTTIRNGLIAFVFRAGSDGHA